MKNASLKMKLFIPTAIVLTIATTLLCWLMVSSQTRGLERSYIDHLATFASNSAYMMHVSAEELALKKQLKYFRASSETTNDVTVEGAAGQEALRAFETDHSLETFQKEIQKDGEPHLVVFSAGRLRDECSLCHSAYGVEKFKAKQTGDLVAAFGIIGSKRDLIDQKRRSVLTAFIVGFLALATVLSVVNWLTNRIIIRPLKEFVLQSERVADGDLARYDTPEIAKKMESADEIGQMARAYREMLEGLRSLINSVREATSAVASSSTEISASTEQMASGSREQTAQAGEVAASVEDMTKTIIESAQTASRTAETSKRAREAAEKGGSVVDETVVGMKRIAGVVSRSSAIVKELGQSSTQIGEIIGVIDDIADQTNLLALNAAIEAARAGEEGRGFAVVADEVRQLAERTTKATKEIASMIKNIQVDTAGAVSSMEEGTREVEKGITLADKAGMALRNIVQISQDLTGMVAQIAATGRQQSTASEQISRNVEAISAVTAETANGTQQIARAAEDLNRLTDDLQKLVATFKLPQSEGSEKLEILNNKPRVRSVASVETFPAGRDGGTLVQNAGRQMRQRPGTGPVKSDGSTSASRRTSLHESH
jgi:methyl-accepting chemotaxis protein